MFSESSVFLALFIVGLLGASLLLFVKTFVEKEQLKHSYKSLSEERDEMEATCGTAVEVKAGLQMRISVLGEKIFSYSISRPFGLCLWTLLCV